MKRNLMALGLVALAVGMLADGPQTPTVDAQVKQGKERPLLTKQLMSGLVRPHCAAIGEATKNAPADDKAWEAVATNAALLNEAGYLLMEDGRCPDGDWSAASKSLREGSAAVLAAVEKKDTAAMAEAFKTVTGSCAACHKAHKK